MTLVRHDSIFWFHLKPPVKNAPEIVVAPPPGITISPQTGYTNAARYTPSSMLTSPTAGTDTTTASALPNSVLPPKTPMKRFRMLFIAIEAIYVMLNFKNKKVPMSALTNRLTDEDLARMQVTSVHEAVEKAQEGGFIRTESSNGNTFVLFATDEVSVVLARRRTAPLISAPTQAKVMLDTKPVENALRQSENESMMHMDRLAKRENIINVVRNSGFSTFQEYLRVAESRGLLKLNASKTMVSLPGASAASTATSSTSVRPIPHCGSAH